MIDWSKVKTAEEKAARVRKETLEGAVAAMQSLMDGTAKQYGYDDIKSAVTYAEEPSVSKFQSEGKAFRSWRSRCWAYCYDLLADIEAGIKPMPASLEEFLAGVPAFDAPTSPV